MERAPNPTRFVFAATLICAALALLAAADPAAAVTFSNTTALSTTPPACGGPPGQANVYPSTIAVSGLTGTLSDVNVTLHGMTWWEGDFEILLVGPAGGSQNLVLVSDAGTGDVSNFTLTLDDSAAAFLPQGGAWGAPTTGGTATAKPTDYLEFVTSTVPADTYPAPAPSPVNSPGPTGSATLSSVFGGINPNGTWSLYFVTDVCDVPGELISGGWSLDITTVAAATTSTSVTSSVNPSTTGQSVTFTATVTSNGSPVTSGTVTFTEGATTLASNVPLNASGQASFSTSSLAEGNHVITATYNGTASFATSNGSLNQRVDNATVVTGNVYCNTGPITTPVTIGTATPYPSNITVSGAATTMAKVAVTLKNVSHAYPDDFDVLLVGPTGQNLVLVSDAGNPGASPPGATNVTVNFDDAAAGQLPQSSPWGTPNSVVASRPVDYAELAADSFPAPAPAPSAATTLAVFNGSNPNGTWSLYVVDDGAPDSGTIAGGWCITVTALAAPVLSSRASGPVTLGAAITDTATLTGGVTPTGTVTFSLYGPNDPTCAGPVVFTSTNAVAADGTATSASFTPTSGGSYNWIAAYSGDANNSPVAGACGDPNETSVVNAAPTVVTVLSITARAVPGAVVVRWRAAANVPLLGFNVYREANGRRLRLNATLIRAARNRAGGWHSYRDRGRRSTGSVRYWVESVGVDGSRTWAGPVRVH